MASVQAHHRWFEATYKSWPDGRSARYARVKNHPSDVKHPCRAQVSVYLLKDGTPEVSHIDCWRHPGLKFVTTMGNLEFLPHQPHQMSSRPGEAS